MSIITAGVHKPRAVPQSAIIAATMMGCDTVLARPPEMALDPEVIAAYEKYVEMNGAITPHKKERRTDPTLFSLPP